MPYPSETLQRATGSIKINLTEVMQLGTGWSSFPLTSFVSSLSKGSDSANAGNLLGNNMFYDNDYMVRRISPRKSNCD